MSLRCSFEGQPARTGCWEGSGSASLSPRCWLLVFVFSFRSAVSLLVDSPRYLLPGSLYERVLAALPYLDPNVALGLDGGVKIEVDNRREVVGELTVE